MATRRKSRILDEMHATARDLHHLGFIDKRRMGEFDVLCIASWICPARRNPGDRAGALSL